MQIYEKNNLYQRKNDYFCTVKILYVVESLANKGGVERILTEKVNYLTSRYCFDVTVVCCTQQSSQPNAFPLFDKVKQVFMAVPYYDQYLYGYPKRLWVKWSLERQLQNTLVNVVKSEDPDILVGIGHYRANRVCSIKCRAKKVVECHEARPFSLSGMSQHRGRLTGFYMKHYRKLYFRTVERKADVVVTLTDGDLCEWERARRAMVIPNFSALPVNEYSTLKAKRVIAVGRLEWEKGYRRMLEIWHIVVRQHPDWHLDIVGNGCMENEIRKMIADKDIPNVVIFGTVENVWHEYAHSSIFVHTSFFEGFGLVLLEAMRHGLPCVAFDCPYGPRSIIEDGKCGFLVNDGDKKTFVARLGQLMDNEELRRQFSQAALEHVKQFDVDVVMGKWKKLFEGLS